jgi:hypothetical protein
MMRPGNRRQHEARGADHDRRGEPVAGPGQPRAAPQREHRHRTPGDDDEQRPDVVGRVEPEQRTVQ